MLLHLFLSMYSLVILYTCKNMSSAGRQFTTTNKIEPIKMNNSEEPLASPASKFHHQPIRTAIPHLWVLWWVIFSTPTPPCMYLYAASIAIYCASVCTIGDEKTIEYFYFRKLRLPKYFNRRGELYWTSNFILMGKEAVPQYMMWSRSLGSDHP